MYSFAIGSYYTFTTKAPAILGTQLKNVELLAIVNYETANTFINVELMHRKIYPLLSDGTVNNPKKYTYLLIKTADGTKTAIAYEWIDESSIVLVSEAVITVTLTGVSVQDAVGVKNALTQAGFKGFTVDVS